MPSSASLLIDRDVDGRRGVSATVDGVWNPWTIGVPLRASVESRASNLMVGIASIREGSIFWKGGAL